MMTPMRHDLPSGTVTFLFTDVESSTKLLHELGAKGYAQALAEHRRVLRQASHAHDGVEVDTQGDAFFFSFPTAPGAIEAAAEATDSLASGPIRVRMGIHTGTPLLTEAGYVGTDVHVGARIAASGHGGQVLLSQATSEALETELTYLGEHRLKDFQDPVGIFQLGRRRFPPLKTVSNTNLPRPASSFVGRQRELQELASLLTDGARLVTLTGPGGSGKTRLAIEAAAALVSEFKAGVFWVGLAAVRDSALVAETIAYALGAKDGLAGYIGERELLILLDNFEHVVEAAPELAELVERCPNLALLVTSRQILRVSGEVEYRVLPLAEAEAAALFCARSGAQPDVTVYELCRALDKLPLALELAAGRANVLSPEQILGRLGQRLDLLKGGRDAGPRQQTLRATIEWSCDLLEQEETRLFADLAVFAGGCTLAAAEKVVDAELDILQSLVDKSLLAHTEDRFWMLETIREYAAERLQASRHADELRERHAQYFLALAKEAEPNLFEYSSEWLDRLEREHDNLRAALDRLEAEGEIEVVLRLAGALSRFWGERGHLAEGQRRLESALGTDDRPTAARAKALNGAADMAVSLGDAATARLRAEEALELHSKLGDAWGAAESRFLLGFALADEGDWTPAQQLFDESARQFRELGEPAYALVATRMLAWMSYRLGDSEGGQALHENNLRQARELGNQHIEASTLGALAMIALDRGRLDDAVSLLKESHRIERPRDDPIGIAIVLCRVARVLASAGQAQTAARLLSSSDALHAELGASPRPWLAEMNRNTRSSVREQLGEAAFAEAFEQGAALTAGDAVALALDALDRASSGGGPPPPEPV
jgi:predicted ATPase/class 3 adenylate cyclase